jgi:hypothetical protein
MVRLRKSLIALQPNTSPGSGCPIVSRARVVVSRESDKRAASSHPAVEFESTWKADS